MTNRNQENWKVIPNFPKYAVSNQGRVKRLSPAQGTQAGLILTESYGRVSLYSGKRMHKRTVRSLVSETFGNPATSLIKEPEETSNIQPPVSPFRVITGQGVTASFSVEAGVTVIRCEIAR